jgi:hypothetical protein
MNRKRLVLSLDVNVRLEGSDVSTGGRDESTAGSRASFSRETPQPLPRFWRSVLENVSQEDEGPLIG